MRTLGANLTLSMAAAAGMACLAAGPASALPVQPLPRADVTNALPGADLVHYYRRHHCCYGGYRSYGYYPSYGYHPYAYGYSYPVFAFSFGGHRHHRHW